MSEESHRNSPPQSSPQSGEGVQRGARPAPNHAQPRVFLRLMRHFLMRLVRGGHESETTRVRIRRGALAWDPLHSRRLLLLPAFPKIFHAPRLDHAAAAARSLRLFRARQVFLHLFSHGGCRHPDGAEMGQNSAGFPGLPEPRAPAVASAHDLPGQRRRHRLRGGIIAVDFNGVSAVLFPLVAASYGHLGILAIARFMASHAASLILASLFTFCAILALLGTLAAMLPRAAFRAFSSFVRGAILIGSVILLVAGPSVPRNPTPGRDSFRRSGFWGFTNGSKATYRQPWSACHTRPWRRSRLPSSGWWRHMRSVTGAASRA